VVVTSDLLTVSTSEREKSAATRAEVARVRRMVEVRMVTAGVFLCVLLKE
jgi:hypothetical protein